MTSRRGAAGVLLAVALSLAGAALSSCGYSTGSLVDPAYRTVAVPIFGNATRRSDLEIEVTRAVVEELQARTHLRVVPESASPDLLLRGVLHEVDERGVSRRDYQRIREQDVYVTAEVQVDEVRSGRALVPKRLVTEREAFVPVLGEDVRTAREEAVRALAERVVRTLESSW